jgi:hypothetical protein
MQTWPALLGAPSLVLITLTVNYAMVPPACASGNHLPMAAFGAIALACSAVSTIGAGRRWRDESAIASAEDVALPARPGFIACVATFVGVISTLALLAMWIPQWLISACAR